MTKLVKFMLVAAALLSAGTVMAGYKINPSVTINTTTRTANGVVSSARNSADGVQSITCTVYGSATGLGMSCQAVNSAGVSVVCSSLNANLVTIAQSVVGDSNVYFQWDANNNCTYLNIQNTSITPPKQP